MLVHKGGQINNVQLINGVKIAEMSQLQNCSVRGEVGCVQRMKVNVKAKVRGIRADMNGEVKLL